MQVTRASLRPALLFIAGLVAVPFIYTGVARVVPFYTSFWDVAVGIIAAIGIWVFAAKWRPAALGFASGSILYAVFFVWLFSVMGSID